MSRAAAVKTAFRIAAVLLVFMFFTGCKSDEEKLTQFYDQATEYFEEGKFKEALIEYKNVLKIDPNHAEAHWGMARTYLRLQQGRDAYWELSETVRLDPSNVEARLSLGGLALLARDFEQANTQGRAVIELEPDSHQGHVLAGKAMEQLDNAEEAEVFYIRAVELDPENTSTILILGAFYAGQGRKADAEPWFWKATEVGPDFRTYSALAKFLVLDPERRVESEHAFTKALEVAEENRRLDAYKNLATFYIATDRGEEGVATLTKGIDELEEDYELVYMLARYYRSMGEDETAEELVKSTADANPDDPDPQLIFSTYLGRKGDLEGALVYADRALAADPESINARLRKAEIKIDIGFNQVAEGGDPEAAAQNEAILEGIEIVDSVLSETPSMPEANFVKGKALLALGKNEEGLAAVRAAAEGKPDWAEARFVLGSALAATGDRTKARVELARSVELDPNLLEARRLLAAIHQDLGEHEYAIEQGRRYLRAQPDNNTTRVLVAQSLVRIGRRDEAMRELEQIPAHLRDAQVNFALGRLYASMGDQDKAYEFLIAANEMSPGNAKVLRTLFQLDRMNGKLADSKVRLDAAIEANPDDPDLIQLVATMAFIDQDLQRAEDLFKRATELDAQNIEAHQQLARFYQLTGRTDETIETYKKAIEASPGSAQLHHFLALLYESQGETQLAIESYEEAIELDSRQAHAKNNLAYLLTESGQDLDRALDLAQDAKALLPNSANAADTLGWVLYKRGVSSAAVGYLKEAVEASEPDDPALVIIRHHLALAYEADGQKDRAVAELELAVVELDRRNRAAEARGQQVEAQPLERDIRSMLERLKAS